MGNGDDAACGELLADDRLQQRIGGRVDGRRRLVQHQHLALLQQNPSQAEQLPLPRTPVLASVTHYTSQPDSFPSASQVLLSDILKQNQQSIPDRWCLLFFILVFYKLNRLPQSMASLSLLCLHTLTSSSLWVTIDGRLFLLGNKETFWSSPVQQIRLKL
jgi:hypothetical protein